MIKWTFLLLLLTASFHALAITDINNNKNANELNNEFDDDLLLESDDFEFELPGQTTKPLFKQHSKQGWWSQLKTTFQQGSTQAQGVENNNRSKLQLDYESSVSDDVYIKLEASHRYFYQDDVQAKNKGRAYGDSKLQQAWLQVSHQQCAYTAGRKPLVWGEVDGTFVVDVLTPLDLTEQLFTDYADLRQGDDIFLMDCYWGSQQSQIFYTPVANIHRLSHSQPHVKTGQEWGGRYKFSENNLDISFMLAQLYWNAPALNTTNFKLYTQQYNLAALGVSKALGRLLIQFDGAYKSNQIDLVSSQQSDTVSWAIGGEYTSSDNQRFNLGLWQSNATGKKSSLDRDLQITLGWSRNALNDDLSLSLLSNVSQNPQIETINLLAVYKVNDVCTVSSALGVAHMEGKNSLLTPALANESFSASIKFEF